jgi:hypothetical protein
MKHQRSFVAALVAALGSCFLLAACSDSNSPNTDTTLGSQYFPLNSGTWWRYKTPDSTSTRAVRGPLTILNREYTRIYEFDKNDTLYYRREDSSYFTLYFDKQRHPLSEGLILDETPNLNWGSLLDLKDSLVNGAFRSTPVKGSMTVNGRSYVNDLALTWVAYTTKGGVRDTIIGTEYFARGIGETLLILNGDTTESLLDYHIQ